MRFGRVVLHFPKNRLPRHPRGGAASLLLSRRSARERRLEYTRRPPDFIPQKPLAVRLVPVGTAIHFRDPETSTATRAIRLRSCRWVLVGGFPPSGYVPDEQGPTELAALLPRTILLERHPFIRALREGLPTSSSSFRGLRPRGVIGDPQKPARVRPQRLRRRRRLPSSRRSRPP